MMRIVYIILALLVLFGLTSLGCKKESIETPQANPPIVQPASNQDPALFGVWIGDSMKQDGAACIVLGGSFKDTLTVTADTYKNIVWMNGQPVGFGTSWTTSGDSIKANPNYKYKVTGSKLWTYANSVPKYQYWYHKK